MAARHGWPADCGTHNQQVHDLFIGEVLGAWADTRVFSGGHWHFERTAPPLRSLHYVAGGQFYATDESVNVLTVSEEKLK